METNALQTPPRQDTAGQVTDPSGIVFDTTSGISLEEQQEILAGINAMSGGNRLVPEAAVTVAKRRGILFPLFVNIGAIILLVLGFVLLSHFHVQDEQGIRENSATLGLTERKLIQEIRQQTNRQISEKEHQINDILSKLSDADAEYQALQGSLESLTQAQKERAVALLQMQEEYRSTLSGLQEEKAGILEDSRQREAALRTQAEEKAKELSSRIEQGQASFELSQASLNAAMEELGRLSNDQERAARAENQMAGYYATENSQISSGLLDEAAATLGTMKEFLGAPSLQGIRSLEARKQTHLAAIAAIEGALAETRRLKEAASREGGADLVPAMEQDDALAQALAELQARYAALEQKASDQERTIAAFSSQGSEQGRMIAEFENRINELRTENTRLGAANVSQQETLNRRDTDIVNLRTENAGFRDQVQTTAARAQQSEAALELQRRENATLTNANATLRQRMGSLPQIIEDVIERPEVQNQLGPGARQDLIQMIRSALQQAIQE